MPHISKVAGEMALSRPWFDPRHEHRRDQTAWSRRSRPEMNPGSGPQTGAPWRRFCTVKVKSWLLGTSGCWGRKAEVANSRVA